MAKKTSELKHNANYIVIDGIRYDFVKNEDSEESTAACRKCILADNCPYVLEDNGTPMCKIFLYCSSIKNIRSFYFKRHE